MRQLVNNVDKEWLAYVQKAPYLYGEARFDKCEPVFSFIQAILISKAFVLTIFVEEIQSFPVKMVWMVRSLAMLNVFEMNTEGKKMRRDMEAELLFSIPFVYYSKKSVEESNSGYIILDCMAYALNSTSVMQSASVRNDDFLGTKVKK